MNVQLNWRLNHYQPAIPEKYHSFIAFDIVTCAVHLQQYRQLNIRHIFTHNCTLPENCMRLLAPHENKHPSKISFHSGS